MVGGKELVQETALFTTGKVIGNLAGIIVFSLVFSFILNRFSFNKSTFITVLIIAAVLHIIIQGMVKKRWL